MSFASIVVRGPISRLYTFLEPDLQRRAGTRSKLAKSTRSWSRSLVSFL